MQTFTGLLPKKGGLKPLYEFFAVLAKKVKRITVSFSAASLAEDITGQGVPQVHEIPADLL